ncbi:hypothetical protein [Prauserella muralis]|uniref:Uncharacterized protein n=1 Tax=Prauserella muralis TaxID=588067 RepID=A0A2V4AF51_9PSEU|nr:hypothetical protein [Prauserella muralis]PXY16627.1 hypothetical protein BAY60_36160 [Prauserella muralis]TWE11123.1 hypothetical protein FHX69_7342 [Prauserella muralis]
MTLRKTDAETGWPAIIDGWIQDHAIRRDLMALSVFALVVVLLIVVAIAGVIPAGIIGWISGSAVAGIGSVSGVRWLRARRAAIADPAATNTETDAKAGV